MGSLASEVISVLRTFKNVVIEGPPGTGKTYVVSELASQWKAATGRDLAGQGTSAITFHPSTTYEDFVEGLRYDDAAGKFAVQPGFLKRLIATAESSPTADFLVLLDELNRANVPKVLGDVLVCMESSKRSTFNATTGNWDANFTVTLPYSGHEFAIPSNIYFLATMNSSDRSIAPLDTALRRRFAFVRSEALPSQALREQVASDQGPDAAAKAFPSIEALANVNEILRTEIGPDALLGHSYIFDIHNAHSVSGRPQAEVMTILENVGSFKRAFWLETVSKSGGAGNQINLPTPNRDGRVGLADAFYPLNGQMTRDEKTPLPFTLRWDNRIWTDNVFGYNPGGPNWKLQIRGRSGNDRMSRHGAELLSKFLLFFVEDDDTVRLEIADQTDANLQALRGASYLVESTTAQNGDRHYGYLNDASTFIRPPDTDAVRVVWRYVILPQLIDTVTQLGSPELFDTDAVSTTDVQNENSPERVASFAAFLLSLGLRLRIEGGGLGRQLTIVDVTPSTTVASDEDEDENEGHIDSSSEVEDDLDDDADDSADNEPSSE